MNEGGQAEKRKWKFSFRRRDVVGYAIAVLLSFVIWSLHNLSLKSSEPVSIPIRLESNLEGRSLRSSDQAQLLVRCRATGFGFVRISRLVSGRELVCRVDPQTVRPRGGDRFYVLGRDLQEQGRQLLGEDVSIESILSDTLYFTFPHENGKKVPVELAVNAGFHPQYMAVGSPACSPDSVFVYGEPARLEQIRSVRSDAVRASRVRSDLSGSVRLISPGGGLRLSAGKVRYRLRVQRFVEMEREVSIQVHGAPVQQRLIPVPSSAKVVLKCAFPALDQPFDALGLYVDYEEFLQAREGICLIHTTALPDNVLECRLEPATCECILLQ